MLSASTKQDARPAVLHCGERLAVAGYMLRALISLKKHVTLMVKLPVEMPIVVTRLKHGTQHGFAGWIAKVR